MTKTAESNSADCPSFPVEKIVEIGRVNVGNFGEDTPGVAAFRIAEIDAINDGHPGANPAEYRFNIDGVTVTTKFEFPK